MNNINHKKDIVPKKVLYASLIITSVLGIAMALSGITHGIFEILQGFKPANGSIIQAISPEFQRWENGEEAFTLIRNFLITGILAVCISIIIIIWSVGFVHKNYGRTVFLALFILLTLVGGGLGFIIFYLLTWAYATNINKPLNWWEKILSPRIIKGLSKAWLLLLIITILFFITGLTVSVFGLPGTTNQDTILTVCWSLLLASLVLLNFTYISGFAYDIRNKSKPDLS